MTAPLPGRCYCGDVRFEVDPPTDFVSHCHCESCRLSHGAPLVTWTCVPDAQFRFTSGEPTIRWYRSSDVIEWGFCSRCGSSMLYRAIGDGHSEAKPGQMYVTVASLPGGPDRAPRAHVSYEERVPWLTSPDGLPKEEGETHKILPE